MNLRLKTFLWNPACHSLVARKYVFGVTWKLFFISFKGVCIWVYITAAPFTTLTGIVGSLGFSHILSGVLSSQVCGGCAFDMHFPSAEVKRLYVLDVLTQFFSFLFWRNMCSGLLFILTFFFCCFLLSIFRPFTFCKLALHWTKLYISSSIVWLAFCLVITSSTMRNSLAW